PSLIPLLKATADEVSVYLALVCDTAMWNAKTPAITTMLRGLVGEEVTITGPNRDLHSGAYGGAARNPIHVLTRAIADLRDDTGKITLPGFYDGVIDLPKAVTDNWEKLGATDETLLEEVGLKQAAGEQGFSALEQIWTRPTCEVNGIWGGYTGEGFKTVLPSVASAKISFRLVGHQNPDKIRESFRTFIRERIPADCLVEFAEHGSSPAVFIASDSDHVKNVSKALGEEWEAETALIGCGGSIPIVGDFKTILNMDSLLTGFALDNDNIHSPNEKYDLRSYHKGIRSWVRILAALAKKSP
ncbi:MAG: M20/M25/M40 family metallo-hydrolase, partial [Devosiaceae bacterium]|nr:M20/M25/M40 family metallo-hydrolase [Devosiaceae bacterium]